MNIRVVKFVSDSLLSPLAAKTYSFTKAIHSLIKRKDSFLLRLGVVMVMTFMLTGLRAQISQVGTVQRAGGENVTTLTVTKPAGLKNGDIMIMNVAKWLSGNTTAPTMTGWTRSSTIMGGASYVTGAYFYRVVDGTEGNSFVINLTGGVSTTTAAAALVAYTNVDLGNPFDGTINSIYTGTGTASGLSSVPAVTTSTSNSLIIFLGSAFTTGNSGTTRTFNSWTVNGSGVTELYENNNNTYITLGCATFTKTTAGSTGVGSYVLDNPAYTTGVILALKPRKVFRSITSGNWNSTSTWEQSTNGGTTWEAATTTPTSNDGLVTVQSSHTVTLAGNETVSSVSINGTLNMGSNGLTGTGALTANAGSSLLVGGTFPSGFTSTSLNATSTVNYNLAYDQNVVALTYGNLTLSGGGAKVAANNIVVNGNVVVNSNATFRLGWTLTTLSIAGNLAVNGTLEFDIYNGHTVTVGGDLSGVGTLSMTTGGSHVLNLNGANNSIGTLNAGSTTTINYGRAGAQQIFASPNYANLTINGGGIKTLTGLTTVSNVLTLNSGVVNTNGYTFSLSNSSSATLSGGSSSSYINGSLKRALPSGTTTASYVFPVGTSTLYLPFTLANPVMSAAETVTVTASATNAGGSLGATLTAKSNTEFWALTSTNLTGGNVSIARPTTISPYDVVGGSITQTGAYSSFGGTIGTNDVSASTNIGASRYFVFAQALPSVSVGSILGSPFCAGSSVSVSYTKAGTFTAGNVFTAQLSNASGSFASPVTIGTTTSTTSGTISATIPASTVGGTGYRIRVVSSTPVVTSADNGANLIVNAAPSAPTTTGANICIGTTSGVTLSASGAASGELYKWYDAASAGNLLKTSSSYTDNTYTTGVLAATTSYWVSILGTSGCESPRTQVTATYPSAYAGSQTLAGTDSWISHIYDGIALGTYYGTSTQAEIFDQNFGAAATCFPFTAGVNSYSIYTETFSVSNRMNSTKRGLYTADLGGDDGIRLYVDGNLVFNRWVDQAFTSYTNVLMPLTGSSTLRYEYYENGGGNRYVFQNLTKIFDNTLSTNTSQSVYLGSSGVAISGDTYGTLPSGITVSGTGYQWTYSTTPGGARTAISGATGASYTPVTGAAPFTSTGTYYLYRNAVLTTTNNQDPTPYVATLESNACTLVVNTAPSITTGVSTLTGFTYVVNAGPSTQQSFSVTGANLVSNITVTPPTDFEISTTSGSGFQSTPITLTQSGGSVSTTIYVRLKAGLYSGTYNSENITFTADYATTKTVACSGSVTLPTYCASSGITSQNGWRGFTNVTLNTINNSTQNSTSYSNYTSTISTNLILGRNYTLSTTVDLGTATANYFIRVWIDWNADGDFNDTGESQNVAIRNSSGTSTTTLTVPTTAIIGQTRMRVTVEYNQYPGPCDTGFYGEVEDYTIYVVSPTIATSAIAGSPFTVGASVSVPFTVTGAFPAGNVFTAQLSDASGSFSSPTSIGTLSGTGSGTITGTIPSVVSGTAYRIRVVASNPVATGTDNGTNLTVYSQGIYVSTTSVTGLTYKEGLGPSSSTAITVAGSGLTDNIRIEALYDVNWINCFEISTDNVNFSNIVTLPVVTDKINSTTVYVRLKAGLPQGSYTANLVLTSNGQTPKTVSCTGVVTSPITITTSTNQLTGFAYNLSSTVGPSIVQNFTVSGSNLSGNVIVTAPSSYEICATSGGTYGSSLTLTQVNGIVTNASVYVRLKANLNGGLFNENITISSASVASQTVSLQGTVNRATLSISTFNLGSFIYLQGFGASDIQTFTVSGTDLTNNVSITAPTNFEISSDGSNFTSPLTFIPVSGTLSSKTIYVRLKAGLTVGTKGPESVSVTSTGAVTQNVLCSGAVVTSASTITAVGTLNGFFYAKGNGPSVKQSFTVSATGISGNLTVASPASAYEVSLTGAEGSYVSSGSSLTITPVSGKINAALVYVRLKAGLDTATYNSRTINLSAGNASSVSVICNGKVMPVPTVTTSVSQNPICAGGSATLSATGSGVSNLIWTGPNNLYSTSGSVSTGVLSAAGTYSYTATGTALSGVNLLTNGDFELGNTGFGSTYTYLTATGGSNPYGVYWIKAYADEANSSYFTHTPDHTPTGTMQMVIDGATTIGTIVWAQSVAVAPNTDYQFSYWKRNVNNTTNTGYGKLQLYSNNVAVGVLDTVRVKDWVQTIYTLNSGSSSTLQLTIINTNLDGAQNDFSLDDIDFEQVMTASSTIPVSVLPVVTPTLTINASATTVYTNSLVNYVAVPTNPGVNPAYQWKVNGVNAGTSNTLYDFTPTQAGTYTISCTLTTTASDCPPSQVITATKTLTVLNRTNYWKGNISTDWGTAGNWTAGYVPASGDDVEFATNANNNNSPAVRDLVVDGARTVGNLINATNLSTIVPAGKALKVNLSVLPYDETNANKIIIKADASLPNGIFIYNNPQNHPVYATVEMYSKAFITNNTATKYFNWQYFGIPLASMTASPTLDRAYVRKYNENTMETPEDRARLWQFLDTYSTLVPFYGYEISQLAPKKYTFSGKLTNQDFYAGTTAYTSSAAAPGRLPYTTGAWYAGQSLFANSYTAPIDIRYLKFGLETEAAVYQYLTGTLYEWRSHGTAADSIDATPGQYIASSKKTAGSIGIPRYVSSMSNMLIRAMSNSADATFGMKYTEVTGAFNATAQYAKSNDRDSVDNLVYTHIKVVGESGKDHLWLFTQNDCTPSFDNGWDAAKKFGTITAPQLYTEGSDDIYQINGLNDINGTKLGFQAGADSEYKLIFNHYNIEQVYPSIYLFDKVENKMIDITANNSEYKFYSAATPTPVTRFELIARTYDKSSDSDTQIKVFAANNKIVFENTGSYPASAGVYDSSGRFIVSAHVNPHSVAYVTIGASGVYIARINTDNEQISKRLIVK